MNSFNNLPNTPAGQPISVHNGRFLIPDHPIVPFIEGDGVGPDVWRAARTVFDAAVETAYGGRRRVAWYEVFAGERAQARFGTWLPEDTLTAIQRFRVAIKGPLTTPVGSGIRSLNVALRQLLDLYVCLRPVRHSPGVPSPMKRPDLLDVVIFRENTEDVYAGIEWRQGTPDVQKVIEFLTKEMGVSIRPDSGLGVKPMSVSGSKRLIRRAVRYALENGRRSVTFVHKGNIMKFTEGAFRGWGYEVALEDFPDRCVAEKDLAAEPAAGKLIVKDRIADNMFQELLLRPADYDVIAAPNLNGDYLSDACAAQVGGLGMAPGGNLGDEHAVFEATHGTAPKYAGLDLANPSGLILSGSLMFRFMNWNEASDLIETSIAETIREKRVTVDLYEQMEGAVKLKTSQFAAAIIENMNACVAA